MAPGGKWATLSRRSAARAAASILLTERGTFFGYNRLVNDFHRPAADEGARLPGGLRHSRTSTQQPAGLGNLEPAGTHSIRRCSLARRWRRAWTGLFLECHPDPRNAKSDAATMLGLNDVEPLLTSVPRTGRSASEVGDHVMAKRLTHLDDQGRAQDGQRRPQAGPPSARALAEGYITIQAEDAAGDRRRPGAQGAEVPQHGAESPASWPAEARCGDR